MSLSPHKGMCDDYRYCAAEEQDKWADAAVDLTAVSL
jgi:hypothetical protein